MPQKHETVIVGIGLAALSTAARLYELGKKDIAIYSQSYGGTPLIAAINFVLPENPYGDTPEQYFKDMMNAGYQLNDAQLVKEMTDNTLNGYELLKRWGVKFAENPDGTTKLRHVSGHTFPRSLCCTTELIGVEIVETMVKALKEKGIQIVMDAQCVNLLSEGKKVYGITIKTEDGLSNVYADNVVAAWGGVGNLFGKSTYPQDIKGNTLALAHNAGAKLVDIEFLEYEPMVVLSPEGAVGEPCPTAMLGEGAHLLNTDGERFMLNVRPEGEAGSPKTLINKEIWKQVDAGKGTEHKGVWVDLRHISRDVLKAYPWFFDRLMDNGVDPNLALVEVGPMAHSFSGGICVDGNYESSLEGLFAVGEACGGVHGACRCAGNAASQATISGLLCAEAVAKLKRTADERDASIDYLIDKDVFNKFVPKVRALAVDALGIYRKGEVLKAALEELEIMKAEEELKRDTEASQIVESVHLMVLAALTREESRGTHMRIDFPESKDEYKRKIIL